MVKICKDPICDHENCIFSMLQLLSCLVVDDRCYLLMSGFKGDVYVTGLYSFDLLMNDAKLVCEWSGADSPKKAHIYKDKLYYSTEMKFDDGQYDRVTMVYDMNEKTTAPLHQEPIRSSVIWYEGAYEWYTLRSDGSLRRYNMDTGEDEEILSGSLLNHEEGETGFYYMGSIGQKVYVMKYLTVGGITNCKQYDLETGNMQDIGDTAVLLYDNKIYQGVRYNVTEYKNDPHYEYYSTKDNAGCIYGGKFFERDSKTGELHEVVSLSTDGIPDCLMDFCILDGNFLMIKYQTYKDLRIHTVPLFPNGQEVIVTLSLIWKPERCMNWVSICPTNPTTNGWKSMKNMKGKSSMNAYNNDREQLEKLCSPSFYCEILDLLGCDPHDFLLEPSEEFLQDIQYNCVAECEIMCCRTL